MGDLLVFPTVPTNPMPRSAELTNEERAFLLTLSREHLGLTPSLVHQCGAGRWVDVDAARGVLERATPDLLIQVRTRVHATALRSCPVLLEPMWMGRDRWPEWSELRLSESDPWRATLAVLVLRACGPNEPIDTRSVTRVLRRIPELQFTSRAHTRTTLDSAAARGLLVKLSDLGERRDRWHPNATAPGGVVFAGWVAKIQAIEGSRGPRRLGTHVLEQLVSAAVGRMASSAWPLGRPVTVREITRFVDEAPEAAGLRHKLPSRSLGTLLSDATRTKPGLPRTRCTLVRVGAAQGRQPVFDVRTLAGQEDRALYVVYQELMDELTGTQLEAWRDELREANGLRSRGSSGAEQAIGLLRAQHVLHTLRRWQRAIVTLQQRTDVLGKEPAEVVARWFLAVSQLLDGCGDEALLDCDVEQLMQRLGLPAGAAPSDAPGIDFTADEMARLAGASHVGGTSVAAWAAGLRLIPTKPNAEFRHKGAANPRHAASCVYDRPTALNYLAFRVNASAASAFEAAVRLVGRGPRYGAFYEAILRTAPPAEQPRLLMALLLVDGRRASTVARRMFKASKASPVLRARALFALTIEEAIDQDILDRVAGDPALEVREAWQACAAARRRGRLLP